LSLRDSKAAVFPRRQNGSGVQQYDLWVMTRSWREGEDARSVGSSSIVGYPADSSV